MKPLLIASLLATFCAFAVVARADEGPTYKGPPSPSEEAFLKSVRSDLTARFPHASDAEKAGYVRYTSVDDTGAISYADQRWSSDPTHPSQLWYDKDGNLMGADFSVLRPNGEPRPQVWGVDPGRWYEFNGHVHYVVKKSGGDAILYDRYVWNADFANAGGDVAKPSAATLVKLGKVSSASEVVTIFEFPTLWDLIVWMKPHAAGPFRW